MPRIRTGRVHLSVAAVLVLGLTAFSFAQAPTGRGPADKSQGMPPQGQGDPERHKQMQALQKEFHGKSEAIKQECHAKMEALRAEYKPKFEALKGEGGPAGTGGPGAPAGQGGPGAPGAAKRKP